MAQSLAVITFIADEFGGGRQSFDASLRDLVVNPLLAANIRRQQRLDPRPLSIRKPKEISHFNASSLKTSNHNYPKLGIP
jgi:hypothetical protein